jgi:heat shock transcription factor, other eukaryote
LLFQGFHKVDPDRWEWANEGFAKGQKHLLKTIKRKKKTSQETPDLPQAPVKPAPGTENIEIGNYGGLEKEVETLKRDKTLLMQQLVDLRQYQQSSSLELQNLIQRLHVMEQNQQQMMALLAIVVQNPDFLNQLVQQQRRSNWWNGDGSKKRRLIALEQAPAAEHDTSGAGPSIIQYRPPVPEISNQAISADGAFCATPVQPVSSPSLVMPMYAETTSINADTLGSTREHFTGTPSLCDWDAVDMDALFNDLDSMDTSTGNDCQMDTSIENDGQMEVPLSVDDYQQLERDCQVEAQQNCMNPQYGTHQLLYAIVSFFLSSYRNHT